MFFGFLKALQIKDKSEIRILIDYFLPYAHCAICSKAAAAKESEEENCGHEKVFQAATSTGKNNVKFFF